MDTSHLISDLRPQLYFHCGGYIQGPLRLVLTTQTQSQPYKDRLPGNLRNVKFLVDNPVYLVLDELEHLLSYRRCFQASSHQTPCNPSLISIINQYAGYPHPQPTKGIVGNTPISKTRREGTWIEGTHWLTPTSEPKNGGTLGCQGSWHGCRMQSALIKQTLSLYLSSFSETVLFFFHTFSLNLSFPYLNYNRMCIYFL